MIHTMIHSSLLWLRMLSRANPWPLYLHLDLMPRPGWCSWVADGASLDLLVLPNVIMLKNLCFLLFTVNLVPFPWLRVARAVHLTVVTLFVRLLSEATWSVICSDLCVFRTFQFCLTIIYLLRNIIPSRKKNLFLGRCLPQKGSQQQNKVRIPPKSSLENTSLHNLQAALMGSPNRLEDVLFVRVSQLPSLFIQAWGWSGLVNPVCLEDFMKAFYCLPPELKEIPIEGNVSCPPRTSSRLDGFTLEKTATQHHLVVQWLEWDWSPQALIDVNVLFSLGGLFRKN